MEPLSTFGMIKQQYLRNAYPPIPSFPPGYAGFSTRNPYASTSIDNNMGPFGYRNIYLPEPIVDSSQNFIQPNYVDPVKNWNPPSSSQPVFTAGFNLNGIGLERNIPPPQVQPNLVENRTRDSPSLLPPVQSYSDILAEFHSGEDETMNVPVNGDPTNAINDSPMNSNQISNASLSYPGSPSPTLVAAVSQPSVLPPPQIHQQQSPPNNNNNNHRISMAPEPLNYAMVVKRQQQQHYQSNNNVNNPQSPSSPLERHNNKKALRSSSDGDGGSSGTGVRGEGGMVASPPSMVAASLVSPPHHQQNASNNNNNNPNPGTGHNDNDNGSCWITVTAANNNNNYSSVVSATPQQHYPQAPPPQHHHRHHHHHSQHQYGNSTMAAAAMNINATSDNTNNNNKENNHHHQSSSSNNNGVAGNKHHHHGQSQQQQQQQQQQLRSHTTVNGVNLNSLKFVKPASQCPKWDKPKHRIEEPHCPFWHPRVVCSYYPNCQLTADVCGYAHPFCGEYCNCDPRNRSLQMNHRILPKNQQQPQPPQKGQQQQHQAETQTVSSSSKNKQRKKKK